MTQKHPGTPDGAEEGRPEAREAAAGEDGGSPETCETPEPDPAAGSDDLLDRLVRAEAETETLKEQLLRALAEAENTRRRAERDREETGKFAVSGFARDMLGVADNLARAMAAVPAEARSEDERLKGLCEGVEMTSRELEAVLARQGISRVDPLGEPFDPNLHQAMYEVEDTDQPPGTVVAVMQPGYVIHDRLLRPAMVGVAKKRAETQRVDTNA